MLKIYGLKNCDTCRAARKWLIAKGVSHEFFDLRDTPLDAETIRHWLAEAGLDTLLNKRGTTWRKLNNGDKEALNEAKAVQLMIAHPALIKRPVFCRDGAISLGFAKDESARSYLL
jgi:Spx/MgsR family transcriptional regulator